MKLSQLKIDPEFQSKIPPLQFEEEQQLEQNIIAEGRLLNPIITWNGYILDGHTRYRILKKHGFIKFEVEEIQLANKYEALAWICKNQLGRRNLSPERKKFLLGKEYESTKLAVGGQPGNCNKVNRCDQNDHIDSEKRTCERIAVEHGVGSATVRRAEKYSRGIDAAEEAVPGAQEEILTGHIKATDEQIVALASIPKEERPAILEELKKKKSDRDDTILERLKPSKPPPKPKSAPQKKSQRQRKTTRRRRQNSRKRQYRHRSPSPHRKRKSSRPAMRHQVFFRYYADMEPHIGSEQGGKRPVVVLQNNIGNRHSPTLIVATVTTRTEKKKNQPTHVLVDSNPAFEEPSMILLEQIFTIDKSRIERFMGYASKAEMLRIDMALLVSLALNVLSGNRSE